MIALLLLLSCAEPADGDDWTGEGGRARVQAPPGHDSDVECWVWVDAGNAWYDALGGPECFPRKP